MFENCAAFDNANYGFSSGLDSNNPKNISYSHCSSWNNGNIDVFTGKYDYDNGKPLGIMSEGIKKLCTFDFLFENGCVDDRSVIFIDNVETSLDSDAVCRFLELINEIAAKMQTQFFISSRSAIVLKKN